MSGSAGERGASRGLLERLEPFVLAPRWRFAGLDLEPFGRGIGADARFDILSRSAAGIVDRLVRLDRLTFGATGMPMPEWLFVDASALPGAIVGLGLRARDMPPGTLERLGYSCGPDELAPLSMYIAVPAQREGVWYGHNLASLNREAPELSLRGLGGVTKALGLRVMRCREQLGATQWSSAAISVHTRFGPMELLTAWTPAHANPATLTYRLRITEQGSRDVLAGLRRPTPTDGVFLVNSHDRQGLLDLEHRLERGERLAVVGPPEHDETGTALVPVGPISPARSG
ncbi:MAG: hypothetical protein IT431_13770 [Phycisphaerales bacterium]|nr:hypothetical protein [Phycisphaerales bacterium]